MKFLRCSHSRNFWWLSLMMLIVTPTLTLSLAHSQMINRSTTARDLRHQNHLLVRHHGESADLRVLTYALTHSLKTHFDSAFDLGSLIALVLDPHSNPAEITEQFGGSNPVSRTLDRLASWDLDITGRVLNLQQEMARGSSVSLKMYLGPLGDEVAEELFQNHAFTPLTANFDSYFGFVGGAFGQIAREFPHVDPIRNPRGIPFSHFAEKAQQAAIRTSAAGHPGRVAPANEPLLRSLQLLGNYRPVAMHTNVNIEPDAARSYVRWSLDLPMLGVPTRVDENHGNRITNWIISPLDLSLTGAQSIVTEQATVDGISYNEGNIWSSPPENGAIRVEFEKNFSNPYQINLTTTFGRWSETNRSQDNLLEIDTYFSESDALRVKGFLFMAPEMVPRVQLPNFNVVPNEDRLRTTVRRELFEKKVAILKWVHEQKMNSIDWLNSQILKKIRFEVRVQKISVQLTQAVINGQVKYSTKTVDKSPERSQMTFFMGYRSADMAPHVHAVLRTIFTCDQFLSLRQEFDCRTEFRSEREFQVGFLQKILNARIVPLAVDGVAANVDYTILQTLGGLDQLLSSTLGNAWSTILNERNSMANRLPGFSQALGALGPLLRSNLEDP